MSLIVSDLGSIELKEMEGADLALGDLNVSCLIDLLGKLLEYELLMISGQLLPKLCIEGFLVEKERYQSYKGLCFIVIHFSSGDWLFDSFMSLIFPIIPSQ